MAVAEVNVKREAFGGLSLTAMPNVREKDVSISIRNHEPNSFIQFPDNYERRPLAVIEAHPKSLLKAMELMTNSGAHVVVPLEALLERLEKEESSATWWTGWQRSDWRLQLGSRP
jgi:hypothetical protein